MHHVHFPLSTGHMSGPLTVQAQQYSTACNDSCIFTFYWWQLSLLGCVSVCKWFPACQRIAMSSHSMAVPLKLQPVMKHSITSHNTHILRDSPVRTSNLSDIVFLNFITLLSPHALSLPTHCHSVMSNR
jgi:hypothetical protein